MGDMKTPDFDDLLAAFDIPDATSLDAKEAIQESQDEEEGHLKHSELCMDATVSVPHPTTTSDAPAVSVIVKNTNRQDSYEPLMEKDSSQLGHLLQNGFRSSSSSLETHLVGHSNYTMLDTSPLNGDCSSGLLEKVPLAYKPEDVPPLSKSVQDFSPVSSPESEEIYSNSINNRPRHEDSYFPNDTMFVSADSAISDNHGKSQTYSMIDKCHETDPGSKVVNSSTSDAIFDRSQVSDCKNDQKEKRCDPVTMDDCINDVGTSAYPTPETNPSSPRTCVKTQTSKMSSCLDALVALNTKKEPSEQSSPKDLPVARKEMTKVSPKVPISPRSPRSPLEVVKRLIKQPDSPMSVCSDSSGKASPALVTGSPPGIPRVRIKTIKTSSGQIKRTVTSIFPDSETEDLQSPFGSSPSQSSVEDAFSKTLPVCHSHDVTSEVIFENGKQEAAKTSLLGCTSANNEAVKSSKKSQSPTSYCGLKRTLKANKQRKSPSQGGCSTNPNYLPKALHLANLNLVPHSVAASVAARSSTHRQDHSHLSSPTVCSVPLVHQVQKTSPNTQTIIPSTAAGTLNRLLNYSNPVPTYVPNLSPPPESDIRLPVHGYCCLECGDSFGLEKSLAFHYSRRSVHIEVTCTHCSKTLVFFNRCALLAHARDHKTKGMMMQCSQLFMKPIAVSQMLMPTKPDQSASQIIQGRSTEQSIKIQAAMPLYPEKAVRDGLKCLECNKQMSDYVALAGHYQRSSAESEGLMCKVCTMLLPNKCSYRAHQRIHSHKPPFCCPECGALSRSVDFQKHVKENCLHYARKVRYSCLHCKMLFVSLPLLKSHIEEKHCKIFYKCTNCPVAFKTSDGCLMHVKSKHGDGEPLYQLIHKCSCEAVFKKKQLLYQHLHQRTCIFKCPECTSIFMQKLALVEHFKEVHGGVFRGEMEKCPKPQAVSASHNHQTKLTKPSNGAVKEVRDCLSRKSSSVKNTGWTCGECLLWVPDRENYVSHMKTSHGKLVKRNPCRLCERSFNSSTSLRRHIRNDHDGKKKVYTCWYCTNERMTFTQLTMLKKHLSLMHGVKNPDFSLMTKLASQETSKDIRLGSKRAAPKDRGGAGDSGTSHSTSAKQLKPIFRCAKCGLTTEDTVQFQEHIPQHKTDADTPQCQHCGLCFTSQLALNRHLYIVHKVKEPDEQEVNKKDLSDIEGTGMQAAGVVSTNQQSKQSQHRLLSPGKTVSCTSEIKQTETGSQTLALESLSRAGHSGSEVQTSGTNGNSVEEDKE